MTLGTTQIIFESSTVEDAEDVCECLKVLYSTRAGELGLDRDFGISMDAVDRPSERPKNTKPASKWPALNGTTQKSARGF